MGRFFLNDGDIALTEKRRHLQRYMDHLVPLIRRRLAGKFRSLNCGAYDLEDVTSSTRRRIDAALTKRNIRAESPEQLDQYIARTAERVAIDAMRRQEAHARLDTHGAVPPEQPPQQQAIDTAESARQLVQPLSGDERAAVQLWSRGHTQHTVAHVLGIKPEAQRSRWRRLWDRLRRLGRQEARTPSN